MQSDDVTKQTVELQSPLLPKDKETPGGVWETYADNKEDDGQGWDEPGDEEMDDDDIPNEIYPLYYHLFLSTLCVFAQQPMLLLHTNHMGWTSHDDVAFIAYLASGTYIVNIFSNSWLGSHGIKFMTIKSWCLWLVVFQTFMCFAIPFVTNQYLFAFVWVFRNICYAAKGLRYAYLCSWSQGRARTKAMTIYPIMMVCSGFCGPFFDTIITSIWGESSWMWGDFEFTVYRLIFLLMAFIQIPNLWTVTLFKDFEGPYGDKSQGEKAMKETPGAVEETKVSKFSAQEIAEASNLHSFLISCFFIVNFLIKGAMGMVEILAPAILINYYGFTNYQYATIMTLIAVISMIPSFIIWILVTMGVTDKPILFVGLAIKIGGLVIMASPGQWRAVLGVILSLKATIFYAIASRSLTSKLTTGEIQKWYQSYFTVTGMIGSTIGNFSAGYWVVHWYFTIYFNVIWTPVALGTAILLHLNSRGLLDPDDEKIVKMLDTLEPEEED